MTTMGSTRRRGRHAEAALNDRRVLDAAREVFATWRSAAPVAAVAERAGVGIGSLYRRYGTKEELMQRLCIVSLEQIIEAAELALCSDDAWSGLTGYIRSCVGFRAGALTPLAGTIETTPQMRENNKRARRLTETLVARARDDEVLRPDVTTLDILSMIEHFSRHGTAEPDEEADNTRQRLLAIALDGLRNQHAEPLPGHPPSTRHYDGRWEEPRVARPALGPPH